MKMKRKLVALAVGAAVATPAVSLAEVTVYGAAQVEIVSYSYEDEAIANKEDGLQTEDQARGRIGVKVSEDLGNGWKGLAKWEFKTDTTDNVAGKCSTGNAGDNITLEQHNHSCSTDASIAPRESMVGLKGSAVTVMLGNLKQPYKYAGGVKYDPFVATSLQARGNAGMSSGAFGHNGFAKNNIGIGAGSGPVKFELGYGPSEGDGSYSLAVKFVQDAFEVFVAANSTGDLLDDGDSEDSKTKIGGQWKGGPHKISFQMEMTTEDDNGTETDVDYMYFDYNMKMGKNLFDIAFGSVDVDGCSGDGCSPTFMRVAVAHKFTKQTRIFGGYRSTDSDGADAREDVISVGLRKDF